MREVRDGYHVLLTTQNGSIESSLSITGSAPNVEQWPFYKGILIRRILH